MRRSWLLGHPLDQPETKAQMEIGRQGESSGRDAFLGDAEAAARWGSEEVEVRRIGEDVQTLAFPGEGA